jgi:hypothetical protein
MARGTAATLYPNAQPRLPRIVRSVARASRIASAGPAQVAAHQGQVAGGDRRVGAAAQRDPQVGLGQGRRVVDPVTDHGDPLPGRLALSDHRGLVGRQHPGDHIVDADLARHRGRRRGVVAGQQHRSQSHRPEGADRRGRGRLHGVRHGYQALGRPGPADQRRRTPPVLLRRVRRPQLVRHRQPLGLQQLLSSDHHRPGVHLGHQPEAGPVVQGRHFRHCPPLAGVGGDRPGDRMARAGLGRPGEAHQLLRQDLRAGDHRGHAHPALGDRPGFVQHDDIDRTGGLQGLRAADQDAELGAAARADQQRRRRGQAQRAGAGDDEHRLLRP